MTLRFVLDSKINDKKIYSLFKIFLDNLDRSR